MTKRVVIIGSGMAGLTGAIRLSQCDCRVSVLEARDQPGGLASNIEVDGLQFDAGPYVLLDRPGLEWAWRQLDLELADDVQLHRVQDVYELGGEQGPPVRIYDSLDRTADEVEARWPGCGARYRRFILRMQAAYTRLQPLQWMSRPSLGALLRTGAWREGPLLLRSLQSVLASTRLPPAVIAALGIWTHVAGQTMAAAPSPLAMVPSLIHTIGAYYPAGGIGVIPNTLFEKARALGVQFHFQTRVNEIRCNADKAVGVETDAGDFHAADAVISNAGLSTYLRLLEADGVSLPRPIRHKLGKLPLQSPGVCAYLAVRGAVRPPYLKFRLQDEPDGCRLLVTPNVVEPSAAQNGWSPARLIAPMHHDRAESGGESQQRAFLERVLAEPWWQTEFEEVRIVATRIPHQWGSTFHLFRNSMNPVMTAQFMRAGRLAHRSPWIGGLYLTGSATHPGQWVSFCAVSGVLAANQVLHDLKR